MARKLTIDTSIATDIKSAASDSFKDNIKMIEIGKLKESIDNFYSLSDIDILADDIERQGLKHNLVVVEDSDELGTYFIKSGHRRFNAIKQLVRENKYSSKFIPCLVDGSKTKDENILDLIMLNATTRVMTDSELYKQHEVLKETLEHLKADGIKVRGRLRDKVAEALNVSPAQVGKIENIKHNAVDEVKEAVETGDMTIATADSIAKLPKEEQEEIIAEKPISEITTKDINQRKEVTADSEKKETTPTQITSTDEELESVAEKQGKLLRWAQSLSQEQINFLCDGGWYNNAIKGYLMSAAKAADFSGEQIKELLSGLDLAFDEIDKIKAEKIYMVS